MYREKIKLAVIFGGQSHEHEVSVNSAQSVIETLDKEKYEVIYIAITKKGHWLIGEQAKKYLDLFAGIKKHDGISIEDSESLTKFHSRERSLANFFEGDIGNKIDLIFPIVHGAFGEDGKLQGMLEMLGLPYLFSDTLASALAMNKPKTQIIVKNAGLKVLPHFVINKNEKYNIEEIIKRLSLPLVVKPTEAGSSIGVSIVKTIQELEKNIQNAFNYGNQLMLEKYKKGRELTVGVIGNYPPKALPVLEIIPQISDFYDYKAKYQDGGSRHVCPAEIPDDVIKRIQRDALTSFRAIGCRDLARSDFIWSEEDDQLYFLEINTIPGMTSVSLVPEAAKAAGMNFSQFLDSLIAYGLKRV